MSRVPSTTGLALATLPAAALVGLGAAVAFRPDSVLGRLPALEALIAAVDPGLVVLALAVVFVLLAPALGIAGRLRPSTTDRLVPESISGEPDGPLDRGPADPAGPEPVVGAASDRLVALATAYDDEPREIREDARNRLLESLRPIAATAYANRAGIGDDEARAAIEAGTWTDDPRAAAFLAADDGPSTPLWLWLVDLVSAADPFVRHLERTLDEIERLQSAATVVDSSAETAADERTDGIGSAGEVSA